MANLQMMLWNFRLRLMFSDFLLLLASPTGAFFMLFLKFSSKASFFLAVSYIYAIINNAIYLLYKIMLIIINFKLFHIVTMIAFIEF